MSSHKRVLVVYPEWYGNTYGQTKVEDGPMKGYYHTPEKQVEMWCHGATMKNPNAIMVEDDNGWVHVVHPNIIKEVANV